MDISQLLAFSVKNGASDLHLSAGMPPLIRVDGEIKLVDAASFEKPSTRQFQQLLQALGIDRSCLLALADVRSPEAISARNIDQVTLTQIDRVNVFDLLNHRYLLAHKDAFEACLERMTAEMPEVREPVAQEMA